jgi:copine 1/2/3
MVETIDQVRKSSKMHLFVSCKKLKNEIDYSGLDPFVEVFEKFANDTWMKIGNTEVILNTSEPAFLSCLTLDYYFEEHQLLKFNVYNSEDGEPTGFDWNLIGTSQATIGQIVGSKGQTLINPLYNSSSKKTGYLVLRIEEIPRNNEKVVLEVAAKDLEDVSGYFSSLVPFFYLSKQLSTNQIQRIYMSESCPGVSPSWKTFEKSLHSLCSSDIDTKLILEVYHYKESGNHEYIAASEFTLNQIINQGIKQFELVNPKKKLKSSYKNSGVIEIRNCNIVKVHTFVDYISGGCDIELEVAIDFTGSNKHPSSPNSLHYISRHSVNQYEQALTAMSEILLCYDSDQKVPMYGFGGKVGGVVSHCFHLNGDREDPYVYGLEGIIKTYKNAFKFVNLSGPTLLAQVLEKVILSLETRVQSTAHQFYTILLILTDGEINDMDATIDWIVRGSELPLSIIIVGIGNDSFDNMKILEAGNNALLDTHGKTMIRNIVQFIPFREVKLSEHRLAKVVLDEIPKKIVTYFKIKGIPPNNRCQFLEPNLGSSGAEDSCENYDRVLPNAPDSFN